LEENTDSQRVLDVVRGVATRVTASHGYDLVDAELKRGPDGHVLRLFVDKVGGIGLDELQAVSEEVSAILDVEDPIERAYTLECSSPGLDRPFSAESDWRRAVGRLVKVSVDQAVDGRVEWTGRLQSLDEGVALLVLDKAKKGHTEVRIPLAQVTRARLEVDWKKRD
jgi:ribosome maturation factor RimP